MQRIFRICAGTFDPKDPTGAALSSEGRWHKKGQRVLYFGMSLSTCVLEFKANGVSYATLRMMHHFSEAEIPDDITPEIVTVDLYKPGWQLSKDESQDYGSKWYTEGRSLLLLVKSSVITAENNLVMNTTHPDFGRIAFTNPVPVELDPRLID